MALLVSVILLSWAYYLRTRPIYFLQDTISHTLKSDKPSIYYSRKYIEKVHCIFASNNTFASPIFLSDDSLFLITLDQVIRSSNVATQDYPTAFFSSDTIISRFHVKSRKNFDVVFILTKADNHYLFANIYGLDTLLVYYPQYLTEVGTGTRSR